MYILDQDNNSLIEAPSNSFSSLNLKERQHLQEWIAKQPNVLGEELLIIQKEFDGFSGTQERLDLLALDKKGNLVVIENKLDDSGKDVTWQAIKYASYCSSLSQDDILNIYSDYLQKYTGESNPMPKANILSFMEMNDWDEIELNNENTQRIIFVAANFRKEITSSVLWLRGFGIDASCVKVSLNTVEGMVVVDFDVIIPIVDAEDYTIKMAQKKKAESQQAASNKKRKDILSAFWQQFIAYNQQVNGDYASSAGSTEDWIGKGGIGISGVNVNVVIAKDFCRTEIYINTGSKESNKRIFDFFYQHKDEIEKTTGHLSWERRDDIVTSRISITGKYGYLNDENVKDINDFFLTNTSHFVKAFSKCAKVYKQENSNQ